MNTGVVADVDTKQAQSVDVGVYPRGNEGGVNVRVKEMSTGKQRRISKR